MHDRDARPEPDLLLQRLDRLSARLNTTLRGLDAAQSVTAAAREALDADACVLMTQAPDGEVETFAADGEADAFDVGRMLHPLDPKLPLARVLRTQEPLFFSSRAELLDRFPDAPPDRLGHKAWALLPMRIGARTRGALGLAYADASRLDATTRAFATSVASLCAAALERVALAARLTQETDARRHAEAEAERINLALQERADEFQTLLDVMPIGIAIAHDAKCESMTTNRWLSERLAVDAGRNISKSAPGNDLPYRILRDGIECAPEDLPLQRAARTGTTVREAECEVVRDDGESLILLVSAAPVFDSAGNVRGCLGAFTDITQRRQSERLLAEREARWRRVLDTMPVMLNAFRDDVVVFWNRECERVTGYSADEMVGNPRALELLYPDPEYRKQVLADWTASGDTYRERECRVTCKDGSVRTIAWSSLSREFPIEGWSSWDVGIDVTARRLVEHELRESEARFDLIVRATSEVLWDCNLATGGTWWNANFGIVFGNGEAEQAPSVDEWRARIHPEDRERVATSIERAIRDAAPYWNEEYRFRRDDGSYAHVFDRGRVLRDESGQGVRMVGSMTDISERVRLQHEASLQRETLARQERLSALGTLVSGVAHEVRTPLAYINNHAHIMRMRMSKAGDEPARDFVKQLDPAAEAIVDGVERIDRLVQDLRRFLRAEPADRARTDVDEAMREAARIFEATHRGNVKLDVHLRSHAVLPLDKVEAQQVVLNLLENAADATRSGGTVTLSSDVQDTPRTVRLIVEDSGDGIPEDVRLHMFDPFYTTKEEGTGLGLSIVRRIVESHGGTIQCESHVGKGTRFVITFPHVG